MKKLSVVLLTLILAAAWTASAFADATPYASVRYQTFYKDTSGNDAGADTSDLLFGLYGTTRLGVKFKVSDEISGLFEVNNAVGLRHAFGEYNFGAGKLLIGQTWRPYTVFAPYIFDDSAGGAYGSAAGRTPQIKLTFNPGVYVALVKAKNEGNADEDIVMPELAIGYRGKAGDVSFGIHGAYASKDDTSGDEEGWVLAADIDAKVDAAKIGARVFYGEDTNFTNFGCGAAGGDRDSFGGYVFLTAYPSDMVAVTGLVGYIETEAAVGDDDNQLLLAINAPIKVAKGFTVVPEIAYVDGLDDAAGDGADSLYVGAKWQFDF